MVNQYKILEHTFRIESSQYNSKSFFVLDSLNSFVKNKLYSFNFLQKHSINDFFLINLNENGIDVKVNLLENRGQFHPLSCSHERVLTKWLSTYNQLKENSKYYDFLKLVFYYINNNEPLKEIIDNDFKGAFGDDLYLWQASLENMTVRSFEYLDSKKEELMSEKTDYITAIFYALYDYSNDCNDTFYLEQFNDKFEFLNRINEIIASVNEEGMFKYEN